MGSLAVFGPVGRPGGSERHATGPPGVNRPLPLVAQGGRDCNRPGRSGRSAGEAGAVGRAKRRPRPSARRPWPSRRETATFFPAGLIPYPLPPGPHPPDPVTPMRARQAVITAPYQATVREVDLPPPAANQVLVQTEVSALSAGTELAVWTGTHQWLQDPNLPDWKFPFRPGYSAAGTVAAVGKGVNGWKPGDRVSYPGNHASAELLTLGHERGRLWKLPGGAAADRAALACIARYGLGAAIRVGLTLGRSAAVLGLGVLGQFALRSLLAAGAR